MSRVVFALTVLGLGGRAAAGPADVPTGVALHYVRGPGAEACPDERTIRDGVAAHIGRDPFRGDAKLEIAATIDAPSDLRATIVVRDAHTNVLGERELHAASGQCAELAVAIELAIAIAIDPVDSRRPDADRHEPAEPTPPAAAASDGTAPGPTLVATPSAAVDARSAVVGARATPPIALAGRLAFLGGIGATPAAAFGIGLAVDARRGAWSLALEGRADVHSEMESFAGGSIAGALLTVAIAPCVHRGEIAACGVATAGALRAEARDVPDGRAVTAPYIAAGGRVVWSFDAGWARLAVQAELALPITRTELRVGGMPVWTTAPVDALAGIAVQRTFL